MRSRRPCLSLKDNTIPKGTRIVLSLTIDPKNDFVTSVTGKVFDGSGAQIGTSVTWSVIGQPTFIGQSPTGPPVTESDLAPLGAFQVVIVGPPSANAHFTAGLGTITVATKPDVAWKSAWPNISGNTGEESNMYYGLCRTVIIL